jgi:hypothetical protein
MTTKQLLPFFIPAIAGFVLAIGSSALSGCGSQRQVPGNATEPSNQISSKTDPVRYASEVAAVPGSSSAGEVASSSVQGNAAQFVVPNPRQHVVSSGFPARDY